MIAEYPAKIIKWVDRILPPPENAAAELERKRKRYWERVDAQVYDRSPKKDQLLDFQREGIEWLGLHPRAILADDMGLGKTVQSLASIVGADAFPCLIITQATLRRSWEAQINRWVGMKSYVMDSNKRSESVRMMKSIPRPFFITHYEAVRAESLSLKEIEWKSIIIDEATMIKNRKSQRTVATKNLKAPRITLLTGTPIMNSPLDLWSLLNYLNPKQYSSYWAFEKKYVIMGGYLNKQVMGFKNVPELHAHAQMWMKRRRKDEVLPQLPDKTFTDVLLDLPKWQRDAYNQVRNEMMLEIDNDKTLTVATALARMTRLKQVAVSPQWTLGMDAKQKPIKLEALEELLEERQTKRTLIFTKYATVANGLAKYLPTKFKTIKIYLLTGATPMDKRGDMEKEFQELPDDAFAVWISTIDAGGMGLTLTSADAVVFMDKDWVPAKNDQAMDRAHRIGQKGNVNVISLIARDTVEEKVEGILDKKRELFNTIIEKDGGFQIEKLTIEDIQDLFDG